MSNSGRSIIERTALIAAACASALLSAAGCEERVVSTSYGGITEHAGPDAAPNAPPWAAPSPAPAANRDAPADRSGGGDEPMRAIALADFEGPDRRREAEQFRARLASRTGAQGLWVADEGDRAMVYHGRYRAADERRAREDLERWRQWRAAGTAPVAYVMLTPIQRQPDRGSRPEYDLSGAAGRGAVSLQIGVYDGENRRELAEQAAEALREDGHEAYYYHGPNYSHITIGTFDESEIRSDGSYGPRLEEAQRQFPHNLANGRTLPVRQRDGSVIDQPSFPVTIPASPGP